MHPLSMQLQWPFGRETLWCLHSPRCRCCMLQRIRASDEIGHLKFDQHTHWYKVWIGARRDGAHRQAASIAQPPSAAPPPACPPAMGFSHVSPKSMHSVRWAGCWVQAQQKREDAVFSTRRLMLWGPMTATHLSSEEPHSVGRQGQETMPYKNVGEFHLHAEGLRFQLHPMQYYTSAGTRTTAPVKELHLEACLHQRTQIWHMLLLKATDVQLPCRRYSR